MANHLAGETSPYLLQHADNPVDWHPWGRVALERAVNEDKPIFLSIGYSACHWCHVMERESFGNESTAALLNKHFVCIKVDREERPDLDAVYMEAVTALTGRGGWPLSVWLTPTGTPFYGGTYFPGEPRFGMPSFPQVVQALAEIWRDRRQEVEEAAGRLLLNLSKEQDARTLRAMTAHSDALDALTADFDPVHGGWGEAPKFPQPMLIEYLLMRQYTSPDPLVQSQIELTLGAMAQGGMYDQLRGGFHRYSTDAEWLVPHFEKMLYDNAQLARCYVHAWQALGHEFYRQVAEETLEYLVGEMRHAAGGFFSSQDADSEGEEGRFFVWTAQEIGALLEADAAELALRIYGITAEGNFEGRSILHLAATPGTEQEARLLTQIRERLLAERERRPRPSRDEKVLASWNGLTLAAFADAARALASPRFLDVAIGLGEFLSRSIVSEDLLVFRTWKDGRASGQGFLEDYACLADGFLALYQATADERWFHLAQALADRMLAGFAREEGGFFDTSGKHERLMVRPRSLQDSPLPSGNALAATVLLKMAAYTGEDVYDRAASKTLEGTPGAATRAPAVFGQWLCALHLSQTGMSELAIVGRPDDAATRALVEVASKAYLPDVAYAFRPPGESTSVSILQGREPPPGGEAAAWVCRERTCSEVIISTEALVEHLHRRVPPARTLE